MPKTIVQGSTVQLPDGTYRVLIWDSDTQQTEIRIVGTPKDPVQLARERGQLAAAQTEALWSDPWYKEHEIDPKNRAAEQMAKDRSDALKNQATQLAIQGRTAEANIINQRAQLELSKAQLLGSLRGPGNAAQFISTGERLSNMGGYTQSLADIAAGKMPPGAFTPGASGKPITLADRMSGLLGASEDQIKQRDTNDRAIAHQIYSAPQSLARGSLESLGPYRRAYLGSYGEAEGFDDQAFQDQYDRAGIMQGRSVRG